MKTVAPCKSLTERRFLAERALVKRYVKITSEPLPRNEVASLCCKQGGTAVIEFIVVPASSDAGTFLFHRLCVLRDHAGCREVSLRRESFSADFFDAIVDSVSNLQKGMKINV